MRRKYRFGAPRSSGSATISNLKQLFNHKNMGCNSTRNYSPYYVQLVQLLFYLAAIAGEEAIGITCDYSSNAVSNPS